MRLQNNMSHIASIFVVASSVGFSSLIWALADGVSLSNTPGVIIFAFSVVANSNDLWVKLIFQTSHRPAPSKSSCYDW